MSPSLNQSSDNALIVEKAIASRSSVRNFTDQKIIQEHLDRLVLSGIAAPSGSNWQNQRFLIVTEKEEITRIGKCRFVWPYKGANQEKVKESHPAGILGHSAALIIVFSDSLKNDRRDNGEYHIWQSLEIQNCSASIENMLIMATSLGIGSCWVSASDKMSYTRMFSDISWRKLFEKYDIPEWYKLQGIVCLGYPKVTDELGYPKGEAKHGATVWQSTAREEMSHYLINKRSGESAPEIKISPKHYLLLKLYSRLIFICGRISSRCDRRIHKIEIRKYLNTEIDS